MSNQAVANPTTTALIASQLRAVYFGGNWTAVSMKPTLGEISWQQAIAQLGSLNSIAKLVYHTTYYIRVVAKVLRGEPLSGNDKHSFYQPAVNSDEDWQKLLATTWEEVEALALLIEQLPEDLLHQIFVNEKYGSYYRNLTGIVEHSHYHLGQIVLIKKMLSQQACK